MDCYCKIKTNSLRIEADLVPDSTWCDDCDCNIDMEELPLSEILINNLYSWTYEYGKWRDKDTEKLVENSFGILKQYNNRGLELTERVRQELGDTYTVRYIYAS